jgi:hypothetical protein
MSRLQDKGGELEEHPSRRQRTALSSALGVLAGLATAGVVYKVSHGQEQSRLESLRKTALSILHDLQATGSPASWDGYQDLQDQFNKYVWLDSAGQALSGRDGTCVMSEACVQAFDAQEPALCGYPAAAGSLSYIGLSQARDCVRDRFGPMR